MKVQLKQSIDSFKDTLNDIKLFSQYSYCYEYIKINNLELEEDTIINHSNISSACFRQSLEFLVSALNTSISTSPLLYSYCLNNLIKGAVYLKSFDEEMLKNFKTHGFSVRDAYIKNNLLDTSITLNNKGVTIAILSVMNNHIIETQQIKFSSLLAHIPEISEVYFKSTGKSPCVAQKSKTNSSDYEIPCIDNLKKNIEDFEEIHNAIGLVSQYSNRDAKYHCYLNLRGQNYIKDNNLEKDIFYNNSIILPQKFNEGIYSINIMFYTYLIIMGYGMLVRYNAHKWEKFIDPKISTEYVLISASIDECVKIFINEVHNYLLGYKYVNKDYTDEDVKRVISESTKNIIENIKKEQELVGRQFGL